MNPHDTTDDRYRVVLLNGNREVEAWLTERLAVTNAAWEAAEFTWTEANVFARWSRFYIRRGLEFCAWEVVPVSPDAHKRRTAHHYAELADEAERGPAWAGDVVSGDQTIPADLLRRALKNHDAIAAGLRTGMGGPRLFRAIDDMRALKAEAAELGCYPEEVRP